MSVSSPSLLTRIGNAIYPWRGAFGVPLVAVVLVFGHPQLDRGCTDAMARVLGGWTTMLAGLFVRVWGVACWFTRNTEGVIGGKRLMTEEGPYPYTRNPRYLGNFLMGLGASILAGVDSVPLAYTLVWCAVHVPIISAEQVTLGERFGAVYESYCRRVPMLIPRLDPAYPIAAQALFVNWRGGLREEVGTVSGWICIGIFLHFWRASHFAGWGTFGAHWLALALIALVFTGSEKLRRSIPLEQVERPEDRPIRP